MSGSFVSRTSLRSLPEVRELADRLTPWNGPLAIACSGGVDSTALLLAAAARFDADVPFFAVHVDHQTRSASSSEGEQVARLCARLHVPCVRTTVNADWRPGEHVAEHRLRRARLAALASVAAALGLDAVVTAHTRDDQVETILMRLFGGTSPAGAAGMSADTVVVTDAGPLRILRPWLDVTRAQIEQLLVASSISPSFDPTNADRQYLRNRIRSEIVPELRSAFPGFPETLLRSVGLARDDATVVDAIADAEVGRLLVPFEDGATIDRGALKDLPRAVASRVVIAAARVAAPEMQRDAREMTAERVGAVLDATNGRSGAVIQLPYGVDVRIEREILRFVRRSKGVGTCRAT